MAVIQRAFLLGCVFLAGIVWRVDALECYSCPEGVRTYKQCQSKVTCPADKPACFRKVMFKATHFLLYKGCSAVEGDRCHEGDAQLNGLFCQTTFPRSCSLCCTDDNCNAFKKPATGWDKSLNLNQKMQYINFNQKIRQHTDGRRAKKIKDLTDVLLPVSIWPNSDEREKCREHRGRKLQDCLREVMKRREHQNIKKAERAYVELDLEDKPGQPEVWTREDNEARDLVSSSCGGD